MLLRLVSFRWSDVNANLQYNHLEDKSKLNLWALVLQI